MGQKYKRFRESRSPFPLLDIRKNPRGNVRVCAAGDDAICSRNRKIVPYHGANPNTRNGAHLRSPSPIMAATARLIWLCACVRYWPHFGLVLSASLAVITVISDSTLLKAYSRTNDILINKYLERYSRSHPWSVIEKENKDLLVKAKQRP